MTVHRKGTTKRWSEVVVSNGLAFLSGQLADDTSGDFTHQCKETLSNCSKALSMGGSDRSHVVSATIYMKDLAHMDTLNALWEDWLPIGAAPGRTTVKADMVNPECLIEITMIAAVR
jgi:enamine deaminase RidA (YjgF/YER057c/UK114 family)